MGSYEVRSIYPTSGLGLDYVKTSAPLTAMSPKARMVTGLQMSSPGLAQQIGGASNLMLIAAVGGVGLLAYLAAKALK